MTPRQRIQNLLEGKPVDRTPFCPAVYEHKAALIGVKPSEMGQDVDLFEKAIIREVEIYDPEMPVVGCDVYNVEAEAAGCRVFYPDSNDVPAVRVGPSGSETIFPGCKFRTRGGPGGCRSISKSAAASRSSSAGRESSAAP